MICVAQLQPWTYSVTWRIPSSRQTKLKTGTCDSSICCCIFTVHSCTYLWVQYLIISIFKVMGWLLEKQTVMFSCLYRKKRFFLFLCIPTPRSKHLFSFRKAYNTQLTMTVERIPFTSHLNHAYTWSVWCQWYKLGIACVYIPFGIPHYSPSWTPFPYLGESYTQIQKSEPGSNEWKDVTDAQVK